MTAKCSCTAIVTGAAGGMGRQTCRTLTERGWHVLALDRNVKRLEALAHESDDITPLTVDLVAPDWESRVESQLRTLPPVHGLANMVGMSRGSRIDELDDEAWHASFAVNVDPAMRLIRLLAPRLQAQCGGSIVNVGSPVGLVGAKKPSYAASKAALHGLTMSCARNLGPYDVRVNLLLPGPTITEMTADWDEERRKSVAKGSFLDRLCRPEEVANVVAFLLSDQASYMTGSVVDLTAGSLWGH